MQTLYARATTLAIGVVAFAFLTGCGSDEPDSPDEAIRAADSCQDFTDAAEKWPDAALDARSASYAWMEENPGEYCFWPICPTVEQVFCDEPSRD